MNRITRRGLIILGTGTAVAGAVLLGAGVGGSAVAGKGATVVAGTNWDSADGWVGTPFAVDAGWAGPTWAGPTANGDIEWT
ncbi:hypothetical protein [Paractinoplanes lichenicola]|uniref:Uncharacterized protein n=1 Tax=Paractinoplanes lichenicola TaxID=2802976 RepID=A0ABS1VZT9_9ACTN|nr:hypothetical protein [Actinoplanes lichenicola]MBL7259818.1 hypothetical protein [Actinoplanes lichenicola]